MFYEYERLIISYQGFGAKAFCRTLEALSSMFSHKGYCLVLFTQTPLLYKKIFARSKILFFPLQELYENELPFLRGINKKYLLIVDQWSCHTFEQDLLWAYDILLQLPHPLFLFTTQESVPRFSCYYLKIQETQMASFTLHTFPYTPLLKNLFFHFIPSLTIWARSKKDRFFLKSLGDELSLLTYLFNEERYERKKMLVFFYREEDLLSFSLTCLVYKQKEVFQILPLNKLSLKEAFVGMFKLFMLRLRYFLDL